MSLDALGWNAHWDGVFAPFASTMIPGRVRVGSRDHFVVFTADGEVEASVAGRLRLTESWPVTGDFVGLSSASRIEVVLPRRTAFVRREPGGAMQPQVIAANADVAFIVMGLDGDYNVRRLERYLYLCTVSGVRPVIVLNKSDLGLDLEERCRACERLGPVVVLNALTGSGLGSLVAHVGLGETAVLLGSSGAGKSTIANRLRGFDALRTAPVRVHDSRGVHTTTHRELIPLELGWLLMDVPGLRELQLYGSGALPFADIAELAAACRFRDCSHTSEPGCAVMGVVDERRLASFHKLQREVARLSPEARLAEKARWRSIHKANKRMYRERGR